jgi:hypothetical protein
MSSHRHADLMAQYAQDARETETPWVRWEIEDYGDWKNCSLSTPMFNPFAKYRRKPEVIVINCIEVPVPIRVAPPVGTMIFMVDLSQPSLGRLCSWQNLPCQLHLLSLGICHLTEKATIKHAEALLSFTKVQD